MATFTTKDANNTTVEFDFDGDGTSGTPFIGRTRLLLGTTTETAAASPSSASGLNGLLRGTWNWLIAHIGTTSDSSSATGTIAAKLGFLTSAIAQVGATSEAAAAGSSTASGLNGLLRGIWNWLITHVGTTADASSSTGSIAAKLRFLITDTIGAAADTASSAGSLMARLREIAVGFESPNRFLRTGTSTTDTISATPSSVSFIYVWNKSTSIRYFQLFDRTTNPTTGTTATEVFVLAPNEKFTLSATDFGIGGVTFSSGLAWGFSTTEATYTAGASADVSCLIRWRAR